MINQVVIYDTKDKLVKKVMTAKPLINMVYYKAIAGRQMARTLHRKRNSF